jgi:hypothetical protein
MVLLAAAATGSLVAAASLTIVWAAYAYWRRRPIAGLRDRAVVAVMFAFVGWSAIDWLREPHPAAPGWRYLGVWVQLVSAFGIAALSLIMGRLQAVRPLNRPL